MKRVGRLHVLTDEVIQSRFSHAELAKLAVSGGADTVQFRHKIGATRWMIQTAREIKDICRRKGVAFIVNDRIDVAIASEADGVHLGQDDFPIPLARSMLGVDRIIGGSASTMEEALKCVSEGADYVGFGPVYPTGSKEDAGPVSGISALRQVVRKAEIPVVAIGGITRANIREVLDAGAWGIAVISAVCCVEKPDAATKALHEAFAGQMERI